MIVGSFVNTAPGIKFTKSLLSIIMWQGGALSQRDYDIIVQPCVLNAPVTLRIIIGRFVKNAPKLKFPKLLTNFL
jgi:hypothetical protein